MPVKLANREDPDQTASSEAVSDLSLCCLSRPFWRATNVRKFTTFTVPLDMKHIMGTLK